MKANNYLKAFDKPFKVVAYDPIECISDVVEIPHGEDLWKFPQSIVAVVEGFMHPAAECEWCDSLRLRCDSRRLA
jgi:hypothetical protein